MLDKIGKSGLTYLSIDLARNTVVVTAWSKNDRRTYYGRGATISEALEKLLAAQSPASQFEDILG